MILHHLNCGCICPWVARVIPGALPKTFCCHCLLIEYGDRLILVDAGFSTLDCATPSRLGITHKLLGFQLDPRETALHHLRRLGYQREDLTDIVLTHLDSDHASGVCDFPNARVHAAASSLEDARLGRSLQHRLRFRPHYLHEDVRWSLISLERGERWMSFERVQESPFGPDLLFVDLPGHTPGHLGVAARSGEGWLLHAGDAFYHQSVITEGQNASRLLSLFEGLVHMNRAQARETLIRIQDLSEEVSVICSHDADFFSEDLSESRR